MSLGRGFKLNPVEILNFSRSIRNCKTCVHNCLDHSLFENNKVCNTLMKKISTFRNIGQNNIYSFHNSKRAGKVLILLLLLLLWSRLLSYFLPIGQHIDTFPNCQLFKNSYLFDCSCKMLSVTFRVSARIPKSVEKSATVRSKRQIRNFLFVFLFCLDGTLIPINSKLVWWQIFVLHFAHLCSNTISLV